MISTAPILAALLLDWHCIGWIGGIAIAAGSALAAWTYLAAGGSVRQPLSKRCALLALRLGAIVMLTLAIAQPRWVSQSDHEVRPVVGIVLDDSQSMATGDRYATAVKLLKEKLWPQLVAEHDLRLFDALAQPLEGGEIPRHPQVTRSPLAGTLGQVSRALRDRPLVALILLSDGIDTDRIAGEPIGDPDRLGAQVYCIEVAGAAAQSDTSDLSVAAVSANERAIVGNNVRVTADIAMRGKVPGQRVAVAVLQGDQPIATRLLDWDSNAPSARVEMEFVPRQAGSFTYAIQAAPVEGETDLDNNRCFFTVDVRPDPINVLCIDGVVRWEGKFLREALANDPDLNVVSSVRTIVGGTSISQGLLLPDSLAKINVVILGDVEAAGFSAAEMESLSSWVTQRGGGLLLTGGYHSFGPTGFVRTPLRQILPAEFAAGDQTQIHQPFNLRLTPVGQESPIFVLTGDRARDTRFFQSLPRLDGCSRIAEVKPGAEVLAVNPDVSLSGAAASLPVMIAQQVGAGRAMMFTADTTWRWRMIVGGFTGDKSFYERFWGQLVRYLAGKMALGGTGGLAVSVDHPRCRIGQNVELTASLAEAAKISAISLDSQGSRSTIPLSREVGKWHASLTPSRPGRLDILVTAEPTGGKSPVQTRVVAVDVEDPDIEIHQTTPDPGYLRRIAAETGGRYLRPSEIDTLKTLLPATTLTRAEVIRVDLWRNPLYVCIAFGLLIAEWVIRRTSLLD